MDNFTSKTKQHRVLGINLLRFSSIVLLISVGVNAGTRTDTLYTSGGAYLTRMSTPSAGITRANIDTSKTRHATADSATIKKLKVDSIQINGGSWLNTYLTGTFPCTLKTSDITVQKIGTAKYEKIGNIVFISLPMMSGTSNSIELKLYCTIPTAIRPTYVRDGWCTITDNGTAKPGYWLVNFVSSTYITFYQNSGIFTSSGTKGIGDPALTGSEITLQYIKN